MRPHTYSMVYIQRAKLGTNGQQEFRSPTLDNLLGSLPSYSGERVSVDSVFGLPAFTQAVRIISTACARCDAYCYRKSDDGGREIDENSPAHTLLTRKANPWQTYFNFRQTLVANAIWSGDGFALIERDDLFNPIALYNLDSRATYPIIEYTEGKLTALWYGVNTDQGELVIPADDIIHIKNIALHTGIEGMSLIDSLRTVLGLSLAVQKWGAIYFKHGAHINKVLKIPGWLTQEQQQQLRDSIGSGHAGIENAHKLAVLMGGSELETYPINNEDGQWLQSREFSLIDCANCVGLPVSFLNGKGFTSYSSLEQDSLNLLNYTLDAWLTSFECELSCKLIKSRSQGRCQISFDRNSLFATDPAFIDLQIRKYHAGAISWQELRQRLNLSTSKAGDFIAPLNLEDPFAPKPAPQAPPEPQGAADTEPNDDDEQDVERSLIAERASLNGHHIKEGKDD